MMFRTDLNIPAPRKRRIVLLILAGLVVLAAAVLFISLDGFRQLITGSAQPTAGANIPVPLEKLPGSPLNDSMILTEAEEQAISKGEAEKVNAAVPFAAIPVVAAAPFKLRVSDDDRMRARACLAAAMMYEAGNDPEGQLSVAQVILNRSRHPAYPSSICGVVSQGIERRTGCQFTFTCDGSLFRRRYSARMVTEALVRADEMLAGKVYDKVGLATHYHTDWVHPYWSDSLNKVARVGTHLFFQWKGYWGSRQAFARMNASTEPYVNALSFLDIHLADPGHDDEGNAWSAQAMPDSSPSGQSIPETAIMKEDQKNAFSGPLDGNRLRVALPDDNTYFLTTHDGMTADRFQNVARRLCGDSKVCRVMGWNDKADIPTLFPFGNAGRNGLMFEYMRVPALERMQSNCKLLPQPNAASCMTG